MTFRLQGRHLELFREHLREHRARYTVGDAEYAEGVLKVSLNTYKKCALGGSGSEAVSLKRHTFMSILSNAGLDPRHYGLTLALPGARSGHGGYDKREYAFICGPHYLYRRSFLTARNITRSVVEIAAAEGRECLTFHEVHYYVSDSGVRDEQHYQGDLHIDRDRSLIGMPSYFEGQVRLTLVNVPQRPSPREKIKMRGALLAYGVPNGYWQPTLSCVFIEGPILAKTANLRDLCETIRPGTPDFSRISSELSHAEERATINTPMLWFKSQLENNATEKPPRSSP